jgi:hypothetical protein
MSEVPESPSVPQAKSVRAVAYGPVLALFAKDPLLRRPEAWPRVRATNRCLGRSRYLPGLLHAKYRSYESRLNDRGNRSPSCAPMNAQSAMAAPYQKATNGIESLEQLNA